jgi:hypothetical protein
LLPNLLIAEQFRLACHHILLHTKIGIGNGPEILHPPLAETAFCQLAVLGRLMAPEQTQFPLSPHGKFLLEPLASVLRASFRLPRIHPEVPMFQHFAAIFVIPPALPGYRLGKEGAVFCLLIRGEGVQPIAKSVYVILPIAHAPANRVSLDLPVGQPRGRHYFLFL